MSSVVATLTPPALRAGSRKGRGDRNALPLRDPHEAWDRVLATDELRGGAM